MLCLSGFELYSCWVPLKTLISCTAEALRLFIVMYMISVNSIGRFGLWKFMVVFVHESCLISFQNCPYNWLESF